MNLERDSSPTGLYNYLPKPLRRTAWQRKTGRRGIGTLKQGLLTKVGYHVTDRATRRREAVKRAVKKYGRASTIRKLNAVAVYTRKRSPAKSRIFKSDMRVAQKMKGGVQTPEEVIALEEFKSMVVKAQNDGNDNDPASDDLVNKAEKLGIRVSNKPPTLLDLYIAAKEALTPK